MFGCLCFPWLRFYTKHKLEDRSKACVFLGYSTMQSAYFCLDVPSGRIYTSWHIQFDERSFPLLINSPTTLSSERITSTASSPLITQLPILSSSSPSAPHPPCLELHQASSPPQIVPPVASTSHQISSPNSESFSLTSQHSEPTAPIIHGTEHVAQLNPTLPSSNNTSNTAQQLCPMPNPPINTTPNPPNNIEPPLSQIDEPATSNITSSSDTIAPPQSNHQMMTQAKNKITKPNTKLSLTVSFIQNLPKEPTTVTQALKDEHWRKSLSVEFDAHQRNQTWNLVPPDPSQNVSGCKWVFKKKHFSTGVLDRYKSRLTVKKFTQQYGVDYAEAFSPIIKTTTIRLVLDEAVNKSWPIKKLDVNNAFLQGTLTEEVYMTQPPGFVNADHPNHVCRLNKAIYGLKQAPRTWYMELKEHLLNIGFANSLADTSLFIYHQGTTFIYLLV